MAHVRHPGGECNHESYSVERSSDHERKLILDDLAGKFAANCFNLRWLVEGICLTKAYRQVSAASLAPGSAQRPVRTLSPDQVFAALDQALSLKKGRGLGLRYTPEGQTLKARLEEARGSTPTDFKGGIPQALLLMNGSLISRATTLEDSLTLRAVVEAPFLKEAEKLDRWSKDCALDALLNVNPTDQLAAHCPIR